MMRRIAGEFTGTLVLVMTVVGSGAMAQNLSQDIGVQLVINTLSTIFALGILIQIFGDISGAHFNPVVTLIAFIKKRIDLGSGLLYILAQFVGGFVGAVIANVMFEHPAIFVSTNVRSGWRLGLSEIIATGFLIFIIEYVVRTERGSLAPILIPAWIGAAYFFTSSTSFANPAVTFARGFSNTFSGIAPSSISGFVVFQIIGSLLGLLLASVLIQSKRR
jgi:glycerol uptake facilitator-like aquaporin